MRDDMARLLLEVGRFRTRGYDKVAKYRRWRWRGDAFDWGESRQRLRQGYDSGGERDYLSPLNRYLLKQVGKPWPQVQDDMLEDLDARRLRDWHLMQHLKSMVGYSRASHGGTPYKNCPFMVNAESGVLELR